MGHALLNGVLCITRAPVAQCSALSRPTGFTSTIEVAKTRQAAIKICHPRHKQRFALETTRLTSAVRHAVVLCENGPAHWPLLLVEYPLASEADPRAGHCEEQPIPVVVSLAL